MISFDGGFDGCIFVDDVDAGTPESFAQNKLFFFCNCVSGFNGDDDKCL
jgi:hypothetical protein